MFICIQLIVPMKILVIILSRVISTTFYPQHLDWRFPEEREAAIEIDPNYLKHIAEISNSNLMWNANSLMAKGEVKIDPDVECSCN